MSRSSREQREAERAARRAERLAQRAEQRAVRKEDQAKHATERADRLAERARRKPQRERDLEQSIEDLVDEVAAKWSRRAEEWIDERAGRIFEPEDAMDDHDDTRKAADRARREADELRQKAKEASRRAAGESSGSTRSEEQSRHRHRRNRSDRSRSGHSWFGSRRGWRNGWLKRTDRGNFYRDTERKKILGVCAGIADYFDVGPWQIRLYSVLGLMFFPTVTIPAYFITYWVMEDKPYYRRVTDRFDEEARGDQEDDKEPPMSRSPAKSVKPTAASNREAMRTAREKFSDIEDRLRSMESHVTSSRFELQRELRKISGEES